MQDMLAQLEELRRDAAECELIRDLATDPKKRELFDRLAAHLTVLASEVEQVMLASGEKGIGCDTEGWPDTSTGTQVTVTGMSYVAGSDTTPINNTEKLVLTSQSDAGRDPHAVDKIRNRSGKLAHLQIAATAQFVRQVFGNIFRPTFGGVEGNDAERVAAGQQVSSSLRATKFDITASGKENKSRNSQWFGTAQANSSARSA